MFGRFAKICALLAALVPLPVAGGPLDDALEVRILPGWRAADGRHVAALHFTLAPGWKTYWRAPGDAGVPPQFDWRGSDNLKGVQVTWPTPKPIDQGGVRTIGYTDELILPLYVVPAQQGGAVRLSGRLDIGVCKDVCLPVTLDVAQDLPASAGKPDPRIAAALADRPYSAREAGVGRVACSLSPIEDGLHLRAEIDLPQMGRSEFAVVETDNPQVWVSQGDTRRDGGRLITETDLYHVEGRAFAIDRNGLRITVLGGSQAVDIQGCPAG